jgi:hypothetical protein
MKLVVENPSELPIDVLRLQCSCPFKHMLHVQGHHHHPVVAAKGQATFQVDLAIHIHMKHMPFMERFAHNWTLDVHFQSNVVLPTLAAFFAH